MPTSKFLVCTTMLALCLCSVSLIAEPVENPKNQAVVWVADLESESFETRSKAMEQLRKLGAEAVDVLAIVAAKTESIEVRKRCFELLGEFLSAEAKTTQTAARRALEKLSESDNESASKRATAILKPQQQEVPKPVPAGNIQIFGNGQIQIQARQLPARVFVQQPEVEVTEDKTTGIVVKVTKKQQNAKPVVKEYKAATLDELKEKHPEGFEHYINFKWREQRQAQAKKLNPGAQARIIVQARPFLPNQPATEEPDELDAALEGIEKALQYISKELRTQRAAGEDTSDLQRQMVQLKGVRTMLESMKDAK